MKTYITSINVFGKILLAGVIITVFSCVPPKGEDLYPPQVAASCGDNILNQDEYMTDCGGTICAPCPEKPSQVRVEIDSTWMDASKKSEARFWNARYIFLSYSGNLIHVEAVDTFESGKSDYIKLFFTIDKSLGRGVYELSSMTNGEKYICDQPSKAAETLNLESGVIAITNMDKKNKLISGTFEFNSVPMKTTNTRIAFYGGRFTDIPTEEE